MDEGSVVELDVERAVSGGRMLARHQGQVVLVAEAIPGERVRAQVERVQRGTVFARTIEVLSPSADRRAPGPDPACGGMTFAHILPARQRALKSDIVADAFTRLAHMPPSAPVLVHASPEQAYRMRVRLHLRGGRLGSFREGTHDVCDPRTSGQLSDACADVIDELGATLARLRVERLEAVEIAENLDGTQRAVHLECGPHERLESRAPDEVGRLRGVTGASVGQAWQSRLLGATGVPWVADAVRAYCGADASDQGALLRRHPRAFFQANRYLTPTLVQEVVRRLAAGPVVDLYAGVGLFAVSAAALGCAAVTAVEGDAVSARDLRDNARPFGPALHVVHRSVEEALAGLRSMRDATLIVDPPRTGISKRALDGILSIRAHRIVYVSCDVATMARDARRLREAGYEMRDLEAFDLFPNTAHVEALAHFVQQP